MSISSGRDYLTFQIVKDFAKNPKTHVATGGLFLLSAKISEVSKSPIACYSFLAISIMLIGLGGANIYLNSKRRKMKQESQGDFFQLPNEIFYQIIEKLDSKSVTVLKQCSRGINEKTKALTPVGSHLLSTYASELFDQERIESAGLTEIVHTLCEIDKGGNERELTGEKLSPILIDLKNKDQLFALNTIPSFYNIIIDSKGLLGSARKGIFTPLQYWAFKGNLPFVKQLVENQALDFYSKNVKGSRSALYRAAQNGHVEVVDYLLKMGAHAAIYFDDNRLHSFIPDFIFHLKKIEDASEDIYSSQILCLKRILKYMHIHHPQNLTFQLKLPIGEGINSLKWVNHSSRSFYLKKLYEILKNFGVGEEDVFSLSKFSGASPLYTSTMLK